MNVLPYKTKIINGVKLTFVIKYVEYLYNIINKNVISLKQKAVYEQH